MSDLVVRLRSRMAHYRDGWREGDFLAEEAANRIEKLEAALDEAAFSQTLFDAVVGQRNKAIDRIEKLEAALREIAWSRKGGPLRNKLAEKYEKIAIEALEGKDD